jgi:hypothetical protein
LPWHSHHIAASGFGKQNVRMVATPELLNPVAGTRLSKFQSHFRIILTLRIATVICAIPVSAVASPLSTTSFANLASVCAPGTEIPTLRAVASVESHFDPFAVRDNTTHESWRPRSLAAAADMAKERLTKGHSVDVGLMQINSANLAALGMTVEDAFDVCHSLTAANRILLSAFTAGSSEPERKAAILIALSRYNTGRPLAGIANGYANQVLAAQSVVRTGPLAPENAHRLQWDIWGAPGSDQVNWFITTDKAAEIKGAGAHSSDARNEGRASAPPASRGEPYEVFAYQESEPIRP